MLGRRHERGDTIIEVMFAFVLFSMVIVGAWRWRSARWR